MAGKHVMAKPAKKALGRRSDKQALPVPVLATRAGLLERYGDSLLADRALSYRLVEGCYACDEAGLPVKHYLEDETEARAALRRLVLLDDDSKVEDIWQLLATGFEAFIGFQYVSRGRPSQLDLKERNRDIVAEIRGGRGKLKNDRVPGIAGKYGLSASHVMTIWSQNRRVVGQDAEVAHYPNLALCYQFLEGTTTKEEARKAAVQIMRRGPRPQRLRTIIADLIADPQNCSKVKRKIIFLRQTYRAAESHRELADAIINHEIETLRAYGMKLVDARKKVGRKYHREKRALQYAQARTKR